MPWPYLKGEWWFFQSLGLFKSKRGKDLRSTKEFKPMIRNHFIYHMYLLISGIPSPWHSLKMLVIHAILANWNDQYTNRSGLFECLIERYHAVPQEYDFLSFSLSHTLSGLILVARKNVICWERAQEIEMMLINTISGQTEWRKTSVAFVAKTFDHIILHDGRFGRHTLSLCFCFWRQSAE